MLFKQGISVILMVCEISFMFYWTILVDAAWYFVLMIF